MKSISIIIFLLCVFGASGQVSQSLSVELGSNGYFSLTNNRPANYGGSVFVFNQINHSSIYWDGSNNGNGGVSDGVYYYVLTLYGCNDEVNYTGDISIFGSSFKMNSKVGHSMGAEKYVIPFGGSVNSDIAAVYYGNDLKVLVEINENVVIFPNPTSDFIKVSLTFNTGYLKISTINGVEIYNKVIKSRKFKIDLSDYPVGSYLVTIESPALEKRFESIIVLK